jgi:hypothetical protein
MEDGIVTQAAVRRVSRWDVSDCNFKTLILYRRRACELGHGGRAHLIRSSKFTFRACVVVTSMIVERSDTRETF